MTTSRETMAQLFGEYAAHIMRRVPETIVDVRLDPDFAYNAARTAATFGLDVVGRFVVKCSWCGAVVSDGDERAGVSHSICSSCQKVVI